MKKKPERAAYANGRSVKPGDLVTGTIDAGSSPAEPFLGQVVFLYPGEKRVQVAFLSRAPSLKTAASVFRRQSRVAATYWDAMVEVSALQLRQRCSRPANRHAATVTEGQAWNGHQAWGTSRGFGYLRQPG